MRKLLRHIESDGFVHCVFPEGTIRINPQTYDCVSPFKRTAKWRIHSDGYRYCSISLYGGDKPKTYAIMEHRLIVYLFGDKYGNTCDLIGGGTKNMVVDHIDGNKLRNRRFNLQVISQRENCSREKVSRSGLPVGVHFRKNKKSRCYQARYTVGSKMFHIGYFDTPEEAHSAYLSKISEL